MCPCLTVWSGATPLNSCELLRLVTDSLVVSATSPLGKMPSANHTRFCSRGQPDNTQKKERRLFKGTVHENKLNELSRQGTVLKSSHTVVVWLFENGHGHHDGRWRRVKSAGGSSLLQRGDGAAVLRWDVGVWTGTRRTHHPLQGLSYKEKYVPGCVNLSANFKLID